MNINQLYTKIRMSQSVISIAEMCLILQDINNRLEKIEDAVQKLSIHRKETARSSEETVSSSPVQRGDDKRGAGKKVSKKSRGI